MSIPLVRNSSPAHTVSNSTRLGDSMRRESVVYWYSFSNPRTRCIHWIVNSYRTSGCDSMSIVVAVVLVL